MNWIVGLGLVPVGMAVVAAGSIWVSNLTFGSRVDALRLRMIASQQDAGPVTTALPEIVRRYAVRAGGRVGAPPVFHTRQEATLATALDAEPMAITAEQWTGTVTPGIVWRAVGRMKGLPVTVFDAYVEGRGELSARLLGTFPVAGGDGPDYDKGELMRYLSELPVYPDAILNLRGLVWREIDERTVAVTGRSATGSAELRFIFDAAGDIVAMQSDDRPMTGPDGSAVPTPWNGIYGSYRQFGRYRIPSYGEVGWALPGGFFTYWRGTVVGYDAAE